ncbi:[protein-PII] uridylyltransferase [Nocardioides guangzhouensis]|uniref:Bifunctional uridylyltransferase/uridylyl-removing enzyme n=1 Tax=Nocardioides guangzhouensis TaxID=2497878 RepID=A0A4Q4ZAS2_9ACTN|nr:[protein-PII] uridylyltransferase [Nocardioides guangzhouensis]RYP84625.1 [protein-PII] uridylyltransferase [Nocardioides guangzhouensis]
MTAHERQARATAADALCAGAYDDHGGTDTGTALVAVGGYGRSELAPYSDLDVVLVHDDAVDPGPLAEKVWYPLWDSGANLDHAVRSFTETVAAAREDLRVALGLLDTRHLAGDPSLTLRLRTTMLAEWRRDARHRLPELKALVRQRHDLMGELAHASVPDVKEAQGGLRDATVLKALVATWLVDAPHTELERARRSLLDVRDLVQGIAGRSSDRIGPEAWAPLADGLGLADDVAAQVHVRELGRRITHISRLTWRRVDAVLARPTGVRPRRPDLAPVAPGIALSSGEVVLTRSARPESDPLMLLRAAAEAAERDAVLAPATSARLVRECPPLPEPWPDEARQLFVRLLAAGRGLLEVWETLEETGGLERLLPEWDRIRMLPHASAIHRFTVDRHVVETCIEASALIRHVARADVLMVAALLHDVGKGELTEHSVAGEPIARDIAIRMGFGPHETDLIGTLVRRHLLLSEVAATRDPEDPATVESVASRLGSVEVLDLLLALTEADAKAASTKAWSSWRAGLVRQLAARCRVALGTDAGPDGTETEQEVPVPVSVLEDPKAVAVSVDEAPDGARVTVISGDRVGLLADAAAMLALQRVPVRAARAWTQDGIGVSVWEVGDQHLDEAVLRQRLQAIVEGRVDARGRLSRPSAARLEPTVAVRPEASRSATVLEVRMDDRPGVVHLVCAALADLEISVRSAHVSTLGPQAVDVFYVQEADAGALGERRAAEAAHAVRDALLATVESSG